MDLPDKIFVDPSNTKVRLSEKEAWVGDIIYVRYSKMIEKERALAAQNSAPAGVSPTNDALYNKLVVIAKMASLVVAHWNEFGLKHGFEGDINRLEKALEKSEESQTVSG